VARQPSGTGRAKQPQEDIDEDALDVEVEAVDDDEDAEGEAEAEAEAEAEDDNGRSEATAALWTEVRVEPVEVALPRGAGFTLRAYRPSSEVLAPEVVVDSDDDMLSSAPEESEPVPEIDEEELTRQALAAGRSRRGVDARTRADVEEEAEEQQDVEEQEDVEEEEDDDTEDNDTDEEDEEDAEEQDEAADAQDIAVTTEPEEVPVFLSSHGRLLLFRTADSLVDFIRSDAEHDLTQLDTWNDLRSRVQADDIVPLPEDTYELDLVVENLRGGPDAWDFGLLIQAGEVARDIGYALRSDRIVAALSPGSPLDDLDEALRASEEGGIGRFFARRRARKIGAETAALGWRTIIGKISALADWRD
jgi:hypothetical protein